MFLYGASGHAKVIIEIAELHDIHIVGLLDDNPEKKELLGYPVMLPYQLKQIEFSCIISIGNNSLRKTIAEKYNFDIHKCLNHPKAMISKRALLGYGTVVMGNAIINSNCYIGKHVIINTAASIDHDCRIEDYVHISPNCTITGGVEIGEGAHIGAGSVVLPGLKIGKWTTIGAGAVVTKNIPDYAVVVGNPGKIIKYNKEIFYE